MHKRQSYRILINQSDGKLNAIGTSRLSRHSDEMKNLNTVFRISSLNRFDKNTLYLFVLAGAKTDDGLPLAGDMPRGKQFGYLFTSAGGNMAVTAAHELGHGIFRLAHTFDDYGYAQKSTQNLMDYSGGKELTKYQWDILHDPGIAGWLDDKEDGQMTASSNALTVQVCDKITEDKKIYYKPEKEAAKLYAQIAVPTSSTIKEGKVKLTINLNDNTKTEKEFTIAVNSKVELALTTLPEGKYTLTCTIGTQNLTRTFFYRVKKYDFACEVCGRDLSITLQKLKLIFPDNEEINQSQVAFLNDALKRGGFTTCKRQSHFFSQVAIESSNFTDFEEDCGYRLLRIYEVFGKQSNDSYKTLFNQSFWDENQHLACISTNLCEYRYEKKEKSSEITDKNSRYTGIGSVVKTHYKYSDYSITFPESFKKDTTGIYRKYTIPDTKKNGENLFNLVYKDKNGNIKEGDGWLFRGRGALQVTGRENYRKTSDKCNNTFGKNFDWENNPDQLKENDESIIYSAVAWFLNAFNPISILDSKTPDQVTNAVNTKGEKSLERTQKFNALTSDFQLFNCEKK